MSVSIKFEADQAFQVEAVDAVCGLFDGWDAAAGASQETGFAQDADQLFAELLYSNPWGIDDTQLMANAISVQSKERNDGRGEPVPVVPLALRLSDDEKKAPLRDFSIEMETGTGKTYVYLRTAIELYLRYGLSKFIIVVPSIAIREGVLSSLRIMKSHFQQVYSGLFYEGYAYESKNVARLRQFASTDSLQFLVMNIQSFSRDDAIIKRSTDGLNGRAPIDFLVAAAPVVIMDEPQKLEARLQREAISRLNPLFKLRYSATHKNRHCLVYRLGPIDAYERRLVKRIQVLSMSRDEDRNSAYVEVQKVTATNGSTPTATVIVNMPHKSVAKHIKVGDDLRVLTDSVIYQGWVVEQIYAPTEETPGRVEFQNGRKLYVRENTGVDMDWWQRAQIAATIEQHLDAELRMHMAASTGQINPTKVLTLFFIDRVANYAPADGKFKVWFEELYDQMKLERKYRAIRADLDLFEAKDIHKGYFASSRGGAKDTRGDTQEDIEAYKLIMKDKETLLSRDHPVRFIFSHSALSEGWDNPNVFVICNLQETQSEMRRRQQIGRGLRLPVMDNGERCQVHDLNLLTVVASETFERFAAELQREISEDTGEVFSGQIRDKRDRKDLELRENFEELSGFKELWEKISPRTFYRLDFNSDDIIEEASRRLIELMDQDPIKPPMIRVARAGINIESGKDIKFVQEGTERRYAYRTQRIQHDMLTDLSNHLMVSRKTIHTVMTRVGRIAEANHDPAKYQQHVSKALRAALAHTIVNKEGIVYYPAKIGSEASRYSAEFFRQFFPEAYEDSLVEVKNSIYIKIPVDSEVERQFAKDLDKRDDVKLFLKLPSWYKIDTPIGKYNPDWAIVRESSSGEHELYLVRETKGSNVLEELRFEGERWKVQFGKRHFDAIEVDYKQVKSASELDKDIPVSWDRDLGESPAVGD